MWNDVRISRHIRADRLAMVPADRYQRFGGISNVQVQPASLDVRLGAEFIRHPDGEEFHLAEGRDYILSPGECVLGSLVETVHMPNYAIGRIEGKSSLARHFLTVHSAGFIDPGFQGDITLELKNDGMRRFALRPGMTIAQISFQSLEAVPHRPYGTEGLNSHYQGQRGPTQSCI